MPGLDLKTNVKVADPKAFCVEFSKVIVTRGHPLRILRSLLIMLGPRNSLRPKH